MRYNPSGVHYCTYLPAALIAPCLVAGAINVAAAEPDGDKATAAASVSRERLRYAGRTFDEWRQQLLYDLDAETCVKAMPAIAAFGKKGYADEAIGALAVVLRDDHAQVVQAATNALAEIGPAAIGPLIDGLSDERVVVRSSSASALCALGAKGRPAASALVTLTEDREQQVRLAAVTALVAVGGNDDAFASTFLRLASEPDDGVRVSLVNGVRAFPPEADWWLSAFYRLADDDNDYLRQLVGQTLAQRAPANEQAVEAIERILNDSNEQVRLQVGGALISPPYAPVKAAVLADLLATGKPNWLSLPHVIKVLGQARGEAELVVPVLAKIADARPPDFEWNEITAAIDALGALGRSARAAVPALERWAFDEKDVAIGNNDSIQKHARRALRKIASADDDHSADRE